MSRIFSRPIGLFVCVSNRHFLIVSFKVYIHMQSRLCTNVCWSVTREWRDNRRSNVTVHLTDGAVSAAVRYRGRRPCRRPVGLIVRSRLIIWSWKRDSQTCCTLVIASMKTSHTKFRHAPPVYRRNVLSAKVGYLPRTSAPLNKRPHIWPPTMSTWLSLVLCKIWLDSVQYLW